jgi:hypothetical protein
MAKRDNPKKRDDLLNLYGSKALTVGELIELLKTYPEDWMVTGYNGKEQTDLVTCRGVRAYDKPEYEVLYVSGTERYMGSFVDIMGF